MYRTAKITYNKSCLVNHGIEVLDQLITPKFLVQSIKRRKCRSNWSQTLYEKRRWKWTRLYAVLYVA